MTAQLLIRRSEHASIVGGICWMAAGLIVMLPTFAQGVFSYLELRYTAGKLLTAAALLLFWLGLAGFHQRWRSSGPRPRGSLGRVGVTGAVLGVACGLAGIFLDDQTAWIWLGGRTDLAAALLGFGLLNLCIGLLLVGAGAMRECPGSGWQSLPLVIGAFGLLGLLFNRSLNETAGLMVWMLFGLSWTWLGLILRAESRIAQRKANRTVASRKPSKFS